MSEQTRSEYVYVTYIRTTPEKLWSALIEPDFQRQYWFGSYQDCAWRQGADWKMFGADGTLADSGEILEFNPPQKLVIKWRNEFRPELKPEGYSRCTYELEQVDGAVKLTITHSIDASPSKFITAVSGGWPRIISNLKSLLETGEIILAVKPG